MNPTKTKNPEQPHQTKPADSNWAGIYDAAIAQQGLKVPYREMGPHYGMEEVQAAVEAMQADILTLGPFLKNSSKNSPST